MMLPEHVRALRQREFEKTKVDKPILDDQDGKSSGKDCNWPYIRETRLRLSTIRMDFLRKYREQLHILTISLNGLKCQ